MNMLQLIPADDVNLGSKSALLGALRAGVDSAEAFSLADGHGPRRRLAASRLRFADSGLRLFRVF